MQSTGIVRNVDGVGRVVIPNEIRETLGLKHGTPMEIFLDGQNVVFRSYRPGCHMCGKVGIPLKTKNGVSICGNCLTELAE